MDFPYGKAPLCILILALTTGIGVVLTHGKKQQEPPDLVFSVFAKTHYEAYLEAVPRFEEEHDVTIQIQHVNWRALRSRLQSAMLVGAEAPDLVELSNGSMGFFTKGPLDDVGFVDLTDRVRAEGLDTALVESRFSLWESRGRIFAMPHDVHPVTLAYRRDLVEELGIDVEAIETWDDFVEMGRQVVADFDGDGNYDRYALDMPANGSTALQLLILQRDGELFDKDGNVAFDSDVVADTICWFVRQMHGPDRIATSAGWGQPLAKAMNDGLVLFYFAPDWRTKFFEIDVPDLSGKMAIMPLPAWEKGGRRTSTWGGTGIGITKQCENFELAWKLVKFLYFEKEELGKRFQSTNIVPPLKDAWDLPEFAEPREFYSGQPIGTLLAELAPDVPADYVHAYTVLARTKVDEALANAVIYYNENGEEGLNDYVKVELKRLADYVRLIVGRNRFLDEDDEADNG